MIVTRRMHHYIVLLAFLIALYAGMALDMNKSSAMMKPLLLRQSSDKNCCFIDACSKDVKCYPKGTLWTDSCGYGYIVSENCQLVRSSCCYIDACNQNRICSTVRNVLKDSCERYYRVDDTCKLTLEPSCCFIDACNGQKICGVVNSILKDSCKGEFTITEECALQRVCCYTDQCNGKRLCDSAGQTLTDSCNQQYTVGNDCKLNQVRVCCYQDACDWTRICSVANGFLTDSCKRRYRVESSCSLTLQECCSDVSCGGQQKCIPWKVSAQGDSSNSLRQEHVYCTGYRAIIDVRKSEQCVTGETNEDSIKIAKVGVGVIFQLELNRLISSSIFQVETEIINNSSVSSRRPVRRTFSCFRSSCAVRVTIMAGGKGGKGWHAVVSSAMKKFFAHPGASDMFQTHVLSKRVKQVGKSTFVVILKFSERFLKQF